MTDLTPNHPAVEAALDAEAHTDGPMSRDTAHYMLEHALPHLTADDLRDTPAGRELMAEGWEEGMLDHMGRRRGIMSSEMVSIIRERIADANPYRKEDNA